MVNTLCVRPSTTTGMRLRSGSAPAWAESTAKGGTVRTVPLDDRGYVAPLKPYLQHTGYNAGQLFRASINGSGGPLSYDAAQHRWTRYCLMTGDGLLTAPGTVAPRGARATKGGRKAPTDGH